MAIERPSTQPSSRSRAAKAAAHGAKPEALAPKNPMVGILAVCCAEIVLGHVAVAPKITAMNSRRRIYPPNTDIVVHQTNQLKGRCPLYPPKRTTRQRHTLF